MTLGVWECCVAGVRPSRGQATLTLVRTQGSGRGVLIAVLVMAGSGVVGVVGLPAEASAATGLSPADFCRHIDTAPTTFGTDELQCLSASSGYRRTSVSVSIPGGLTSRSRMQSFLADVDGDALADFCRYVDTPPTGSSSDELHCASADSNYQTAIVGTAVPGGYSTRLRLQTFLVDIDGDDRADVCRLVDTPPTDSNSDEVQCLSALSTYQSFVVMTAIPGGFSDRRRVQTYFADIDGDDRADLCRHLDTPPTASGGDELHCSSAASNFQTVVVAAPIPGGFTDRRRMQTFLADIDGDGRADLCRHVDTPPTGSGSDELHCASAVSGYQTPVLGAVLPGGFSDRARLQSVTGSGRLTALDTTPPGVTAVTSPPRNGAGWHNQPVTISWESTDPAPTSGLPSIPPPILVSQEGRDLAYESEPSCDPARYCATGHVTVSLDMTDPSIEATVHPDANAAGWRRSAEVEFTCSDALSGLSVCPTDAAVPEGRDRTVTGTAADWAGNTSTASAAALNVDGTPPHVSMSTPNFSIFAPPVRPLILRGFAVDPILADGSPGSGDSVACFELTRDWLVLDDEPLGCFAAERQSDGTWMATPELTTGNYRVRLHATDLAGNTGVSGSVGITVVTPPPTEAVGH